MGDNSEEVLRQTCRLAGCEELKKVYIKKDRARELKKKIGEKIQKVKRLENNQEQVRWSYS